MDGDMTTTIADLMESLQDLLDQGIEPSTEVRLGSDYGDYSHTHQALEVREVRMAKLEESAYSQSGEAVFVDDEEDGYGETPKETHDEDDDAGQVVLITSVREN